MMRVLLATALLLLPVQASGHDWYESACCSEVDCREATDGEVVTTDKGWTVVNKNPQRPLVNGGSMYSAAPPVYGPVPVCKPQDVALDDHRVRDSQDFNIHVCFGYNGCELKCLYVVNPGA